MIVFNIWNNSSSCNVICTFSILPTNGAIMAIQAYISAITCNIIAFVGGTVITWSSPISYKLQHGDVDDSPFGRLATKDECSWIGSMMALGAIFGPPLFGYLSGKYGRRIAILGLGIPFSISYAILAFAQSIPLYYVGRILGGMSVGGLFTVLPMYVGEISEDSNRGVLGTLLNCFVTGGLLFSYCVGPYTSVMVFNIILLIFPLLFVVLFFFIVPESPHFLISVGNEQQAEIVLKRLRGNNEVTKELEQIKEADVKSKSGSPMDLFKYRGLKKALIIGLGLIAFQQLSGITAVLFYAQTIFEASGSGLESAVSSIIVGVVQWFTSFLTPPLADRLGRKTLLMISSIGMIVSEVPLGIYFFLKDDDQDVSSISWLPVVSLVVYIITYNLAYAGLPWAIMGEIFTPAVKPFALSLVASFCWVLGFLISKFFEDISNGIGMGPSFWIFAGFCCLSIVFNIFYLIETKGKSFQEIQDILEH